jgi:hypothetical protein
MALSRAARIIPDSGGGPSVHGARLRLSGDCEACVFVLVARVAARNFPRAGRNLQTKLVFFAP